MFDLRNARFTMCTCSADESVRILSASCSNSMHEPGSPARVRKQCEWRYSAPGALPVLGVGRLWAAPRARLGHFFGAPPARQEKGPPMASTAHRGSFRSDTIPTVLRSAR